MMTNHLGFLAQRSKGDPTPQGGADVIAAD